MPDTIPARTQLGAATTARKWFLDVQDPDAPGVWIGVFGLTESKPRSAEATTQDDSDMDGEGFKSQTVTALTWGFDGKLSRKRVDGAPTIYDPGQEIIRKVAERIGGILPFRYYEMEPGGPRIVAKTGKGSPTWTEDGGGMDAVDVASFTITGRGKPTTLVHPSQESAIPTIQTVLPSGAAAGQSIVIEGAFFDTAASAATYVKIGGVNAASYKVLSPNTILAVLPTGSAGSAPVLVGAGTAVPYTRT